jgi:DNA polymerase III subunit delta'
MSLWDVPGQDRATAVLRGAVGRAEPGHAWAFVGPPGVGQEQAARSLMAALVCPLSTTPGEPCGMCPTCDRCVRGAYGAYRELVPTGAMHRVVDVRDEWLRAAMMSPLEGTWKVLRVVDADRMNDAAANAFLKGLEEPPERTIWILDIADPDELPDTILSRCRVLRFAPWEPEALRREARRLGIAEADVELAVRVASGAPMTLRRLARPGGMDDLRRHRDVLRGLREHGPGYALTAARQVDEEVKRATAAIKAEGATELAELAERYGDSLPAGVDKQVKDRVTRQEREVKVQVAQAALDDLVSWCRDLLLVSAGGDPAAALHVDAPEALRADAEALGPALVLRAIDRLLATREDLERNVAQGLALEACGMDLSTLTLAAARG